MVTLKSPRPHVRAALALDYLDLNPFLPAGQAKAAGPDGNGDRGAAAPRLRKPKAPCAPSPRQRSSAAGG